MEAHGCSQTSAPRLSSCKNRHRGVHGDRAQHPTAQAVGRAAFWGDCGHPVLPGGRPLRGHRALPTCLPRRHVAGGGVALFISLLRHKQVRGAAAKARFLGCRRQPQPAYTSSESVELHAAKTSLATGAPGQRAARNSAQTVGKEQIPPPGSGADCSICPSCPLLGVTGSSSSALRRVMARCDVPYDAPPCRAMPHHATQCHRVPSCHVVCHRNQAEGPKSPSGAAAAPARAWAPSARGMIDLVSASGGLSPCQAPAQTAALKGESPFPLRKAERLQRLVRGEPPAPAAPAPLPRAGALGPVAAPGPASRPSSPRLN